jgi:hypothetical protein
VEQGQADEVGFCLLEDADLAVAEGELDALLGGFVEVVVEVAVVDLSHLEVGGEAGPSEITHA